MAKYFGTDGIRGTFGDARINPDFAWRLGSALGCYLAREQADLPLNAVLGRDTRLSGPALCEALVQGLNHRGVSAHDAGIVPTPAVARAVLQQEADIGIAVTASHNPAADNGIKLFDARGCKFSEADESMIEARIDAEPAAPAERPSPRADPLNASDDYIRYIRSLMGSLDLSGRKIVLDLAHGATCECTPAVFRGRGAELHRIGDTPDGEKINLGVGSEHPGQLGAKVRQLGADIGIAHDGDGDRLVVCDERGEPLEGEILLGLFARDALKSGALRENTLVTTVHSNLGLDRALRRVGGRVERVAVGDRNVAARMREIGANLGGESSGHVIFADFASTGDGLLAAVKLIDLMVKIGKPLSELRREITLFPRQILNLVVKNKRRLDQLPSLPHAIAAASAELGDEGRVLVRFSGTEPKLRLLVEGADERVIAAHMRALESAARHDLEIIDS